MSTAEQIIADVLGEHGTRAYVAAHVVAALANAGKTIVEPTSLSLKLWRLLGDECDDAPEPNYEEDNYDAGFIAGLTHAQETIRAQLPVLLAAARVAEGGDSRE